MDSEGIIEVVSATRSSEADFWEKSVLGRSLKRLDYDRRISNSIAFENRRGLPVIYNSRIGADSGKEFLVFVHDDVWIDDYFLADRLIDGLEQYDVIGLAGNRRRIANQAAWFSVQKDNLDGIGSMPIGPELRELHARIALDSANNLSGVVAHGLDVCGGRVKLFGTTPARCELMDGLFLAARKVTLASNSVFFDPRFDFHFYDLDFCRTARRQGLRIGTWPIAVTHQSPGGFDSAWFRVYRAYLEKWGD